MDLTLDVNVELLPVEENFKFSVELATTLNLDGTPDSGCYEQGQEKSADNRLSGCDYAMHGKVFKYDTMKDNKVYAARRNLNRTAPRPPTHACLLCSAVYMSFGGLLMKLVGDPRHLEDAEMGARLYILMKRIVR